MAIMYTWPTHWLEAAQHAGFCHQRSQGEWVFINDTMRDMLADFAKKLLELEAQVPPESAVSA